MTSLLKWENGLLFKSNKDSFNRLILDMQLFSKNCYDSNFYFDISPNAPNEIGYSFLSGSNRISGWMIKFKDAKEFEASTVAELHNGAWEENYMTIWAYHDDEYAGGWIYGMEGPIFGENIIERMIMNKTL